MTSESGASLSDNFECSRNYYLLLVVLLLDPVPILGFEVASSYLKSLCSKKASAPLNFSERINFENQLKKAFIPHLKPSFD